MGLFNFKKNEGDYIVIVGCGRLGASLANSLSETGGNVLVIDSNKDAFRKLSPSYGSLSITGNATNIDVLKEAQIDNETVVICVTDDDNTNIMVAQMVKDFFKVTRVVARLYDPERACVYRNLDINTICPAILSVHEINRILYTADYQEV